MEMDIIQVVAPGARNQAPLSANSPLIRRIRYFAFDPENLYTCLEKRRKIWAADKTENTGDGIS